MTDQLETVITTSRLKLRAPSKIKKVHLSDTLTAYSTALLELMKKARECFDPEEFIRISFDRGKSRLTIRSLQFFRTWVNRELEIKKLRLNSHLKHGLIYHVSSALRNYAAYFTKDVDSAFPFSKYMVNEDDLSLDEVLTEALTCVTLEQEGILRNNLMKKRQMTVLWPVHLTSKNSFGVYRSVKTNRYYIALPINLSPNKRGRRLRESPLDLINILEDKKAVSDGPWIFFALAMGRRDRDLLVEIEKYRSVGRALRNKKNKAFDVGACALEIRNSESFIRVFIRRVVATAQEKNIMAIKVAPYGITYMVTDHQNTLLALSELGRTEILHKLLSIDKAISLAQKQGVYGAGQSRYQLTLTASHLVSNFLVTMATTYNARIVLQDQMCRAKIPGAQVNRGSTARMKRKKRISSLCDYSRLRSHLEYKLTLEGLTKPFVLTAKSRISCIACQNVLTREEQNWNDRIYVCCVCGHSDSLVVAEVANMISHYKKIVSIGNASK